MIYFSRDTVGLISLIGNPPEKSRRVFALAANTYGFLIRRGENVSSEEFAQRIEKVYDCQNNPHNREIVETLKKGVLQVEWWTPVDRPSYIIYTEDGIEEGDMLGADEVYCDSCGANIEFSPVPLVSTNVLCPDCFQEMFHISVEEAARQAGVTITYKEETYG